MIPDFSGEFINIDSIKDGDIIEILDEGKEEWNKNFNKNSFNIHVKLNDKVKIWSPNIKQGRLLQQVFGMDSKNWIGQKVQLSIIEDTMLIKPIKVEKV